MPPISTDSRKYNPYEVCIEKSVLMCTERGVQSLDPLKMSKIESRCQAMAGKALNWDTPAEKISEVVDDLCPPISGGGGRMMSVRVQGTNPGGAPSGSSAYGSLESEKALKLHLQPGLFLNPNSSLSPPHLNSETVLSRISRNYHSNPSCFSSTQLIADRAVSSFLGEVIQVNNFTALTAGGYAYRLSRLGVLGFGAQIGGEASPFLSGGSIFARFAGESVVSASQALRFLSY
jgi:hypothetical protein